MGLAKQVVSVYKKWVMKKLLLLCLCGFIFFCLSAQKTTAKTTTANNFCAMLSKVRSHVSDSFDRMKVGDMILYYNSREHDIQHEVGLGYKGTVKIPCAVYCFVETGYGSQQPDYYVAFFGTFTTLELATKKLESIRKQLTDCLPDYEVIDSPEKISIGSGRPVNYKYKEKRTDSIQPLRISLNIYQRMNIYTEKYGYTVYLQVDGYTPRRPGKQPETSL